MLGARPRSHFYFFYFFFAFFYPLHVAPARQEVLPGVRKKRRKREKKGGWGQGDALVDGESERRERERADEEGERVVPCDWSVSGVVEGTSVWGRSFLHSSRLASARNGRTRAEGGSHPNARSLLRGGGMGVEGGWL